MSKEPNIIVDEIEVIIAVSEWLHKEGKNIDIISIPKGGKSKKEKKAIIEAELGKYGISPKYEANGPDIVASCEDPPEIWYVECKGSGTGGSSTHRNNFDRLLSSVVSHFGHEGENTDGKNIHLIMALPDSNKTFTKLCIGKISSELLRVLNMKIFMYNSERSLLLESR